MVKGGAAGTVAKTISAYDMEVSDAIYGSTDRYVSRHRLEAMLDHEYGLLLERLSDRRGSDLAFFVFADTMATRSFSRHQDGHGWLGIRFQHLPEAPPSQITIHAWMFDKENSREQEAIGILGLNLVYGAFYHHDFLQRVDVLGALDQTILISSFGHYYSLAGFLRRHTSGPILFALGIPALRGLFDEKYYAELPGGILEGMGRLFSGDVRLYVYPFRATVSSDPVTLQTVQISSAQQHLFRQLVESGHIEEIRGVDEKQLQALPGDVLKLIQSDDPSWPQLVPKRVAEFIRQRKLFGYEPMGK